VIRRIESKPFCLFVFWKKGMQITENEVEARIAVGDIIGFSH
jgi:hypothetical protein